MFIGANYGLNQTAPDVPGLYKNSLDKQGVNLIINVPVVDWGLRKGQYELAKKEREVKQLSINQEEIDMEQDILLTVSEFNLQADMVKSAKEAVNIAVQAYEISKQRFLLGLIDVNALILQQGRKDLAQKRYVQALKNYWQFYYEIRSLTLHDFYANISLESEMEFRMFE